MWVGFIVVLIRNHLLITDNECFCVSSTFFCHIFFELYEFLIYFAYCISQYFIRETYNTRYTNVLHDQLMMVIYRIGLGGMRGCLYTADRRIQSEAWSSRSVPCHAVSGGQWVCDGRLKSLRPKAEGTAAEVCAGSQETPSKLKPETESPPKKQKPFFMSPLSCPGHEQL